MSLFEQEGLYLRTMAIMRIFVLALLLGNVGYAVMRDGFPQKAYSADIDHKHEYQELEDDSGKEQKKTRISPEFAELSGIEVMKASPMKVTMTRLLMGRVTLNENNTAKIRARFPGFVHAVHVSLGEKVQKGQNLATVESNESLITYEVVSPIDGVVIKRGTNVGDVTNGKEIFVVADLSTVWAKYHVFPRDIKYIKEGQTVDIHSLDETHSGDEMLRRIARISKLLPIADASSQTVVAIVELSNEDGIWRPGMAIQGIINIGEKQAPIAVPKTALQYMGDQEVVFTRNGDTYELRPVKVGMMGTTNVEIASGLERGETYVSRGSFVIKADLLKSTTSHEH